MAQFKISKSLNESGLWAVEKCLMLNSFSFIPEGPTEKKLEGG